MKAKTKQRNVRTEVQTQPDQDIFQENPKLQSIFKNQSIIKQQFYQSEQDQIKKENTDLKKTLQINKQIICQLLEGQSRDLRDMISKSLWELEKEVQSMKKERDDAQAQALIKDQIIQELKIQEIQATELYEEQIDELTEKLDRKEYVIQYKEEIWSSFERELKKVVKKDTDLYRKIESTTQILVENLNETKISNVVKANNRLIHDQQRATQKIDKMIKDCCQLVLDEVWEVEQGTTIIRNNYIASEEKEKNPEFIQDPILSQKIEQLFKLVDSVKNRFEILEEENQFLRTEYNKVSKANIQLNKHIVLLNEKLKMYHESMFPCTPYQQSTKACTSVATSQKFQGSSDAKEHPCILRNSQVQPFQKSLPTNEQMFSLNLQPLTPIKHFGKHENNNQNEERLSIGLSELEINLNRFMNQSPPEFLRRQKQQNIDQVNHSFHDDENKENNLSGINPCLNMSKHSPFFDSEESYLS